MAKSEERELTRLRIRSDLVDQLERNGTVEEYYRDLIEDYMHLWDAKNSLIDDIDRRGVTCIYTSNSGQENRKKNESVGELLKVNAQMIKLLDAIGISPSQDESGDEDDEM